jgi:quinoprotein glucose dehydrogenase
VAALAGIALGGATGGDMFSEHAARADDRRSVSPSAGTDWPFYNGDPRGTHYSPLDQINLSNVKTLKVAWTYDSGDAFGQGLSQSDMEGNPLIVGGRLYFVSPKGRLICLDAAKGNELWAYDSAEGQAVRTKQRLRGVSYWSDGAQERILFTFRRYLLSVDAKTGMLDPNFGQGGKIDMREGLGRDPASISVSNVTPGLVYKDLLVIGSTGDAPGYVRAYDVRTGKIRWVFHTIPQPGEPGYQTWPKDAWKTAMGANVWAGMTLDPDRGLVFLPVASAGMGDKDFYGADRLGDDLFGTSTVALDASTGRLVWAFQLTKHDLWDRDPPAQPTLVTVRRDGKSTPAVAQITKSGLVFLLDRLTGKPLFPVEQRETPGSDVPGEVAAKTQVFPIKPEAFARQRLTADLLTKRTPEAHKAVVETFSKLGSRGPYDPPSLQGTIIFPGLDGGGEYGGAAYDPQTGLLYVNANEMAWILRLKRRPPPTEGNSGAALYLNNCTGCHGEDRRGSPPEFPSLIDVGSRLTDMDILNMIMGGGGRMPPFSQLGLSQIRSLVRYLRTGIDEGNPIVAGATPTALTTKHGDDYVFEGYTKFLDPDGYPAVSPPWGTLNAINVNTGAYAWKIPFGEYPELAERGITGTGSENYGGAVVTAGGLLFIGATVYDNKFHAYDKRTGKLLWEATLPAAGLATPATYVADGRQFVVIGAGGGKNLKGRSGGQIVAYALPASSGRK